MGSKRKVAIWYKRGKEFVVMVPSWDHRVSLVFGTQEEMIDWAHGSDYVLRDGGRNDTARAFRR